MVDLNERNPSYELILDAAQELFIEQGVGATSLESIARRANVVRATVYNNFRDKDEIITEIVRRYVEGYVDVLAKLREEDRPSQTSFERIANMIRGALLWRIENAALRPLIDQTKHMSNSKWEELNATADAAMFGWVEEVHLLDAKRGLMRVNLDPEFASRASYSMLEAVISSFDVTASPRSVDAAVRQLALLHWYSIYRVDPEDSTAEKIA